MWQIARTMFFPCVAPLKRSPPVSPTTRQHDAKRRTARFNIRQHVATPENVVQGRATWCDAGQHAATYMTRDLSAYAALSYATTSESENEDSTLPHDARD